MRHIVFCGLFLLVVSAGVATAGPILKFDDPTAPGGTIFYNGIGGPVVGTNILFQTVTGLGTPLNAGAANKLTCYNGDCLLNFTSGSNITEGVGVGTTWTFASTSSSFAVTGSLQDPSTNPIASGTLLSGFFTLDVAFKRTPDATSGQFDGAGFDVKNIDLLTYFGLQNYSFNFSNTEITLGSTTYTAAHGFTGTVNNADLNNLGSPIPEPGTLILLGSGLLALCVAARRRN